MRILSFDIEDRMKGLGYYQIAGGLFGLYVTGRMFVQEPVLGGLQLLFYSIAGGLFAFSIYCGNRLRKSEIEGLRASTWNQILQVFQINIAAFGFSYYAGFRVAFGIQIGDRVIPDAAFSLSGFGLKYTPDNTSELSLLINLVPFLIVYWLDKLKNDIEARKALICTEEQILS